MKNLIISFLLLLISCNTVTRTEENEKDLIKVERINASFELLKQLINDVDVDLETLNWIGHKTDSLHKENTKLIIYYK